MALPLSVLDLIPVGRGATAGQALDATLSLAKAADALGYTRYWIAEHHNTAGLASSTPELVIALAARATRGLRVGSGGIMLPNHSPLKVAETFRTLEALAPGRIDLGVGRAPGSDQLTALALRRTTDRLMADDFEDQLQELQAYCSEAPFPEGAPFQRVIATPEGVPLPPLWLLSSSGFGAELAARLGRGMAFAHHFSPEAALPSLHAYRERFRPSRHLAKPHAILTVAAIASDTHARAEALAKAVDLMWLRFLRGERGPLPTPEEARDYPWTPQELAQGRSTRGMLTFGTAQEVKQRLTELAREMAADELMVTTHVADPAERQRSYELLASAFGLPPRAD